MESHRQSAHGITTKPKRISPKGTPSSINNPAAASMFSSMNPFFGGGGGANSRINHQLNVNMFLASLQSTSAAMSMSQHRLAAAAASAAGAGVFPSGAEENEALNQSTSSGGLQDSSEHTTTTDSSMLSSTISRETSTSPVIDP
uniref:Uncharacterized protein n=1 Tax=Panagrolaimus superbus TaxID=310955 RepID=A0A914YJ81_9BILA